MYTVAAEVIAVYSGKSYTSFVEDRIFAPLGMTSSTFSPTQAEASGKFTQGWTKEGRRVPECFSEEMAFVMAGPGGIISSAVDMVGTLSCIWTLRLPSSRPSGSRRGSMRVSMTMRPFSLGLYTRMYRILMRFLPTTRPIRSTRLLDMAWVGSAARIADTM